MIIKFCLVLLLAAIVLGSMLAIAGEFGGGGLKMKSDTLSKMLLREPTRYNLRDGKLVKDEHGELTYFHEAQEAYSLIIAELDLQVDRMRCCENCKNSQDGYDGYECKLDGVTIDCAMKGTYYLWEERDV